MLACSRLFGSRLSGGAPAGGAGQLLWVSRSSPRRGAGASRLPRGARSPTGTGTGTGTLLLSPPRQPQPRGSVVLPGAALPAGSPGPCRREGSASPAYRRRLPPGRAPLPGSRGSGALLARSWLPIAPSRSLPPFLPPSDPPHPGRGAGKVQRGSGTCRACGHGPDPLLLIREHPKRPLACSSCFSRAGAKGLRSQGHPPLSPRHPPCPRSPHHPPPALISLSLSSIFPSPSAPSPSPSRPPRGFLLLSMCRLLRFILC